MTSLNDDVEISNSSRCVELALEGERRCRTGDAKSGVAYLEAALTAGTDDLRTLSAIYSQLGNAYFYLADYAKALEYHRHDVTLARTIGDRAGEAKASGNLGNTLKVLGKHDEALVCCQRHLEISRELEDKIGESRALYSLGNVYLAKGKHIGRISNYEAGEYPQEVRNCLLKAVEYYEENLRLVQELNDCAAEGRSCGNLGNTFYLLGDFKQAIHYHLQRLNIAKQFGDKPAMRRAYSNLGNAHVFLGEFEQAIECYKQALAIAIELNDSATEAQACYSLGNTATLLGEHEQAVEYHIRHMTIARRLCDKVGQARAAWSLGNAFMSLGRNAQALYFVMLHMQLSAEIGDLNGESIAEQNLSDLNRILGTEAKPSSSADPTPVDLNVSLINSRRARHRSADKTYGSNGSCFSSRLPGNNSSLSALPIDVRRDSALSITHVEPLFGGSVDDQLDDDTFFEFLSRAQSKRMDDQRCDPKALLDNKENRPRIRATDIPRASFASTSLQQRQFWSWSTLRRYAGASRKSKVPLAKRCHTIQVSQAPNIDQLRQHVACLKRNSSLSKIEHTGGLHREQGPDEFLDLVIGIQSRRMDDQRAHLPELPGLQNAAQVLAPHLVHCRASAAPSASGGSAGPGATTSTRDAAAAESNGNSSANNVQMVNGVPLQQNDDDFLEMLIRCQSTRIDEQRSELKDRPQAVTVPDDDFFQLLLKMQARRFEEQRANLTNADTDNDKNNLPVTKKRSN